MSSTEQFEVTNTWAKVQLGGVDATATTLSLESLSLNLVMLQRRLTAETPAAAETGHFNLREAGADIKITLAAEEIWARTATDGLTATIGVIEA